MARSVGEFIPSSSCGGSIAVSLTVIKSVQEDHIVYAYKLCDRSVQIIIHKLCTEL